MRSPALSTCAALLCATLAFGFSGADREEPGPSRVVDGDFLEVQLLLDRAGFSPGELDGRIGANTIRALKAFQGARSLTVSGRPDGATLEALRGDPSFEPLARYVITEADLAGPFVTEIPDDLMAQATLPALAYTSVVEMLGERFHASPTLLKDLNPEATFSRAGESLVVPNVGQRAGPAQTIGTNGQQGTREAGNDVTVMVSESESALTVTRGGEVLFHAPVTTGSEHDPLPIGDWKVTGVQYDPVFHYNPDLFWDADPSHAKARIPAGPNNPVGVAWIDLSREHYGLHGTPEPRLIGRSVSHGCVRMTNWDVLRVAALVGKGTPVRFVR